MRQKLDFISGEIPVYCSKLGGNLGDFDEIRGKASVIFRKLSIFRKNSSCAAWLLVAIKNNPITTSIQREITLRNINYFKLLLLRCNAARRKKMDRLKESVHFFIDAFFGNLT